KRYQPIVDISPMPVVMPLSPPPARTTSPCRSFEPRIGLVVEHIVGRSAVRPSKVSGGNNFITHAATRSGGVSALATVAAAAAGVDALGAGGGAGEGALMDAVAGAAGEEVATGVGAARGLDFRVT